MASSNRRLLESYAVKMKCTIEKVAADGACLLKSVALAVGESSHTGLLQRALDVIRTLDIPESDRDTVVMHCMQLQERASRRLGEAWNSVLFDFLPRALAIVTERPLHIYEVVSGCIKVHVVAVKEGGEGEGAAASATAVPIILVRCYGELGFPHYDLLRPMPEEG